jgi:hypothetical protein
VCTLEEGTYCKKCYGIHMEEFVPFQMSPGGNWYIPSIREGERYHGPFNTKTEAQEYLNSIV